MEFKKYIKIYGKNTKKYIIEIYINKEIVGKLQYGYMFDLLNIFDYFIPVIEIVKNYPNNRTIYIDSIQIEDKFKGNGYSKSLMKEFINDFLLINSFDSATLTVSPFKNGVKQILNENNLEKFYNKFGFQNITTFGQKIMILKK